MIDLNKKTSSITFLLILIFLITICIVSDALKAQSNNDSSSSGSVISADTVYEGSGVESSAGYLDNNGQSVRKVRKHPLAAPTNFIKDGVYIWCDPDGMWTLFLKENQEVNLDVIIRSDANIYVEKSSDCLVTFSLADDPNSLSIICEDITKKAIIQFSSDSDYIDFDILVNDQDYSDKTFIGHMFNMTEESAFCLQNRKSVISLDVSEITITSNPFEEMSEKTIMSTSPISGGSGRKQ